MINVNTIEHNGCKAVINSYSIDEFPILVEAMNEQLNNWKKLYPNAIVRNERLTETETKDLVKAEKFNAHTIGQSSK